MKPVVFPRAIWGSSTAVHHPSLFIGCGCEVNLRMWFVYHSLNKFDDIVNECLACGATGTANDKHWCANDPPRLQGPHYRRRAPRRRRRGAAHPGADCVRGGVEGVAVVVTLTILGAPRTKKNSLRRKWSWKQKRTMSVPSEAYEKWEDAALPQLRIARAGRAPITALVNVKATFYRDADRGDAVGYYQALADALEKAGVLENDRQIVSWDGSRLAKDAKSPRVEVVIEEMAT